MVEVCERGGLPWLYVGHLYVGLAAFWRGDAVEGERRLRLAARLEPPAAFAGQSASLLALHLAYVGRGDDAVEVVESLRPAFPVAGRVNTVGSWNAMFGCVEALAVAGRRDEAADLFPLVMEALELRGEWITFDGALTGTRAAVATAAAGRYDEADRLFAAAADASRELGLRIGMADVRRLHAGMLLERGAPGDPERARAMLDEAASAYGAMGMPPFEALSRSLAAHA
jgi:tetratricopeptide (TPR) repeat protein